MMENREKFEDLLYALGQLPEIYDGPDWMEALYRKYPDFVNKYFYDENDNCIYEHITEGLDADERRWYITSVTVIKIHGFYLGIDLVTSTKSEMQMFEDCGVPISFFEMKQVQTTTYEIA